jgi:hypothetical protein
VKASQENVVQNQHDSCSFSRELVSASELKSDIDDISDMGMSHAV